MAPRFPAPNFKPHVRCKGKLAAAATFNPGDILYELHAVAGCARVGVRTKCSSGSGNLEVLFVGPDVDVDKMIANVPTFANITGTVYSTGNPAAVAVGSVAEALAVAECYGENHVLLKFTGVVGGAIAFCDVGRV